VNHLEIAATTFALDESRGIAGIVVDTVLNQTFATSPNLDDIQRTEEYMQRYLSAWLKRSLMTFTETYYKDVEERLAKAEGRQ
jgi:hypothetical protein